MPDHRLRSRSRSPYRDHSSHRESYRHHRPHSHSPSRPRHHRSTSSPTTAPARAKPLPYGARDLSRRDLTSYRALFALYLDVHKQIVLEDLDEKEVKGRWKSFVGKWNRGELAEGWYDPKILEKARASAQRDLTTEALGGRSNGISGNQKLLEDEEGSDDGYGPSLPSSLASRTNHDGSPTSRAQGATIPSLAELRARDEETAEDQAAARRDYIDDIHHERRLDRKQQQDRLDDLVPRPEAGTRERQLEKKREKAEANRSFAASKNTTGDVELPDSDVMGDEDSLGELKRMKLDKERKKNERELRKEEILRARAAEREIRVQAAREKEEKTMSMFKEIARQRFGGGERRDS